MVAGNRGHCQDHLTDFAARPGQVAGARGVRHGGHGHHGGEPSRHVLGRRVSEVLGAAQLPRQGGPARQRQRSVLDELRRVRGAVVPDRCVQRPSRRLRGQPIAWLPTRRSLPLASADVVLEYPDGAFPSQPRLQVADAGEAGVDPAQLRLHARASVHGVRLLVPHRGHIGRERRQRRGADATVGVEARALLLA